MTITFKNEILTSIRYWLSTQSKFNTVQSILQLGRVCSIYRILGTALILIICGKNDLEILDNINNDRHYLFLTYFYMK